MADNEKAEEPPISVEINVKETQVKEQPGEESKETAENPVIGTDAGEAVTEDEKMTSCNDGKRLIYLRSDERR